MEIQEVTNKFKKDVIITFVMIIVISICLAFGLHILLALNFTRQFSRPSTVTFAGTTKYIDILMYLVIAQWIMSIASIILSFLLLKFNKQRYIYIALFIVVGSYLLIQLINLISLIVNVRNETFFFVFFQIICMVVASLFIVALILRIRWLFKKS